MVVEFIAWSGDVNGLPYALGMVGGFLLYAVQHHRVDMEVVQELSAAADHCSRLLGPTPRIKTYIVLLFLLP